MSQRFWTADIHAGHANIAIYCERPWLRKADLTPEGAFISKEAALETADRMNKGIITEFNMRVKDGDTVVHIGDFCTRGVAKGTEGLRNKAAAYLSQLNGTWSLITGNHDGQNKTKTIADLMITRIGPYTAVVCHYPIGHTGGGAILNIPLRSAILNLCDFCLCGHVHTAWSAMRPYEASHPKFYNINVGVDMHKFRPLNDSEIIGIYEKLLRA